MLNVFSASKIMCLNEYQSPINYFILYDFSNNDLDQGQCDLQIYSPISIYRHQFPLGRTGSADNKKENDQIEKLPACGHFADDDINLINAGELN